MTSPAVVCARAKCRKKGEIRKYMFVVLLVAYVGIVCFALIIKSEYLNKDATGDSENIGQRFGLRHLGNRKLYKRDVSDGAKKEADTGLAAQADDSLNCTPRAIDEFPSNWFTFKQTKEGAIALHILIAIYMFGGLAIVCDDYFVSSLESICDRLNLQEDVAGATFMAAGSSAPEFFTSVIGVFIAKSDVGVGTIVGSAVFNILFIIGVCSIFAGMVVKLTWYPMTRDCLFYLISIAALVVVIDDEHVYWYEALVLFCLYVIYITIMYFNRFLETKSKQFVRKVLLKCGKAQAVEKQIVETDEKQPLSENSLGATYTKEKHNVAVEGADSETGFSCESTESSVQPEEEKGYESPFELPDSILGRLYWGVMMPLKCLMYITIPDCRRAGVFRRLYLLTFIMSIVWIAACSYMMVWMVTIIGDVLDIPDTVMGLTILAAGTSVPDCLSSIFVARDGFGDMAVSNSIGSNVFDILMCLGLPWLLNTTIVKKGGPLLISSGGIYYSALILLSTVAFMLIAINFFAKWKLKKPFGILCLVAYVLVITVSCLFELNVFGDWVLKSCSRIET